MKLCNCIKCNFIGIVSMAIAILVGVIISNEIITSVIEYKV